MIYHLKCPRSYIYIGISILTMICHLFRHIDYIWWISSIYTPSMCLTIYIIQYIYIIHQSNVCWVQMSKRGHPAGPVGRDLANRQRALGDPAWDGSQLGWEKWWISNTFWEWFGIQQLFFMGISIHISSWSFDVSIFQGWKSLRANQYGGVYRLWFFLRS